MTDGQLLLLCFALFTCWESVAWAPGRIWALRQSVGRWTLTRKGGALQMLELQPVWAWPLPPGSGLWVATEGPLLPAGDGLWVGPGQACEGRHVRWEELALRVEDAKLRLTVDVGVKCVSAVEAVRWRDWIADVQKREAKGREVAVDAWWDEWADPLAAGKAAHRYQALRRRVWLPTVLVFGLCFVGMPCVYSLLGSEHPALLGMLVCVFFCNGWVAVRIARWDRRYGLASRWSRWLEGLQCVMLPPHALRAVDGVGMRLAARCHPLALARTLMLREDVREAAAVYWREWKYCGPSDCLHPMRTALVPRIEALCRRLGWTLSELELQLEAGPSDVAYCPGCGGRYTQAGACCQDCGGVPTRAFGE